MNENTVFTLLWMLMAVSLGLMVGLALGDEVRRRKNAEEKLDDLRKHLQQTCSATPTHERQLREIRSVLNDAHRLIHAVSKGLKKQSS